MYIKTLTACSHHFIMQMVVNECDSLSYELYICKIQILQRDPGVEPQLFVPYLDKPDIDIKKAEYLSTSRKS